MSSDWHDSQDARQEVELKMLQNPPAGIRDADRYRKRAVRHALCDVSRRDARRRGAESVYLLQHAAVANPHTASAKRDPADPAIQCERRQASLAMQEHIAQLPRTQRNAVAQVYLQELTASEACDRLGVSPSALNSALYHGRRKLRIALVSEGEEL